MLSSVYFSVVAQCLMFPNFGKLHKLITEGREQREIERGGGRGERGSEKERERKRD